MITRVVILMLVAMIAHAEEFTVTAYCNNYGKGCVTCNGKWAKYHRTANGSVPTEGITCAAPRRIPFGTKLEITGVGTRVVQDRLAIRFDHRIDIYFNDHKKALRFGKRKLNVVVVPSPIRGLQTQRTQQTTKKSKA